MSWDQGVQVREDLPQKFIEWAEKKRIEIFNKPAELQYITWFGSQPEILYLDFGDEHSIKITFDKEKLKTIT